MASDDAAMGTANDSVPDRWADERASLEVEGAKNETDRPLRIGLVLSGGGARGLAHVGVLKALEEAGVEISGIAGNSMGAIVGGLYASGISPDSLEALTAQPDLFLPPREYANHDAFQKRRLQPVSARLYFDGLEWRLPTALFNDFNINWTLFRHAAPAIIAAEGRFDDLEIPFRAVALDLVTGERVVFRDGDLASAIRSSMSIPVTFPPIRRDSSVLVDAGPIDNLPIDLLQDELDVDRIIAVNCSVPHRVGEDPRDITRVALRLVQILSVQVDSSGVEGWDVWIEPDLGETKVFEFFDPDSLIALGYEATLPHLPRIRSWMEESRPGREGKAGEFGLDTDLESAAPPDSPSRLLAEPNPDAPSRLLAEPDPDAPSRLLAEPNPDSPSRLLAAPNPDSPSRLLAAPNSVSPKDAPPISARPSPKPPEERYVRGIRLVGGHKSFNWVPKEKIGIETGDLFSFDELERGVRRLYATGGYEALWTSLDVAGPDSVSIVLGITEKARTSVGLTFQFDTGRNMNTSLEVSRLNLLRLGETISLTGFLGNYVEGAELSLRSSAIRGIPLAFDVAAHSVVLDYVRDEFGQFTRRSRGAEVSTGFVLGRSSYFLAGVRHWEDRGRGSLAAPEWQRTRVSVVLDLDVDTTDERHLPRRGTFLTTKAQFTPQTESTNDLATLALSAETTASIGRFSVTPGTSAFWSSRQNLHFRFLHRTDLTRSTVGKFAADRYASQIVDGSLRVGLHFPYQTVLWARGVAALLGDELDELQETRALRGAEFGVLQRTLIGPIIIGGAFEDGRSPYYFVQVGHDFLPLVFFE